MRSCPVDDTIFLELWCIYGCIIKTVPVGAGAVLDILSVFAIIYLFTGISVGGRFINYNLPLFFILEKKVVLVDFLEALYFSLVTFTTVGYGDIIPIGTSIILSSVEMILGVTMVGIWTATLARKITR